jgi:RHS repeat-associated protein
LTISRRTRPCAGGDRLSRFAEESLDYFPYGGVRIDTKTNYGGVRNKYAGTVYDPLSGLNYMQARYQNSSRGQFISEDPSFLAVGNPNQLKQLTSQDQSLFLADPQQLNSYSYGRDNPITKSDPQGNQFCEAACADLAVYPAAAYFGPAILTGVGAAATYISTDILLRANQPRWSVQCRHWTPAIWDLVRRHLVQKIGGQTSTTSRSG